jgi:hypothetical protein
VPEVFSIHMPENKHWNPKLSSRRWFYVLENWMYLVSLLRVYQGVCEAFTGPFSNEKRAIA